MGIDLTVSGETKLTGLVGGSGITSSFSPRMHTASFAEVGVDAVYLSFPITPEMLGVLCAVFRILPSDTTLQCRTRPISANF